jgi:FMN phosphatase YigB (HAD superfamily)
VLRHILFDLDGTLAPHDTAVFLRDYAAALTDCVRGRFSGEMFQRCLFESTMLMVENRDPKRTNEEVFWDDFPGRLGTSRDSLQSAFRDFHANGIRSLKRGPAWPGPAREIVGEALHKGFRVTIASNPVFPLEAQMQRLSWIGCEAFAYGLITSTETMHACKPHLEYYREVSSILGTRPEECLMVGNDVEEDMVASLVGMTTCLVTDRVIQRGKQAVTPDYRCGLEGLREVIRQLPAPT